MILLQSFVNEELQAYCAARANRQHDAAWTALERAHVLSQPDAWLHTKVHLVMLGYGLALRDWREVGGQLARIAVAALGSWFGKAPVGNTGRARVPIMAVMPVPPDLTEKLAAAKRESSI